MKLDADDIYVAFHEGRISSSDEYYPAADYEALEAELEECRCIKSSYFDKSLKLEQVNRNLESQLTSATERERVLVTSMQSIRRQARSEGRRLIEHLANSALAQKGG